jgi:hypothetical protein
MRKFQVRLFAVGTVFMGAFSLAACSSAASQPGAVAGSAVASATAGPVTTSSADGAAPPPSAGSGPSPTGIQNLVLTDAIRAQLVTAAATLNGLTAADYVGLVKGESYYGFDPATNTYWAGGALDPSPSSQQAQVSAQDDGSYFIFEEQAGGSWTAHAEGMAGIAGATCSVQIPPALVALWRWPAGACHPTGF